MIRIILALLILLFSLLTVFKAPTNLLWKLAVGITEFPFIPIGVVLVLTFWGLYAPHYKWSLLIIHIVSLTLFSLPVFLTYSRVSNLENDIKTAFGDGTSENQLESPFSFWKQFTGVSKQEVQYETIVYKTDPKTDLIVDFYKAQVSEKRPVIIVIHGGSWQEGQGDSQQLPALNSYLANQGWNVFSMSYRLAPTYQYPAPVEDFNDLITFLNSKATTWNLDTSKIVVIGRSAGGQIALQSAYTNYNPNIKGVVSFYGPADMAWGARIVTNKLVLDTDKVLSEYIGGPVETVPEKYDLASAPPYVNEKTPPTLLIHGPIDAMVSYHHSTRLKKKLDQFKVPNYLLDLPTATHGCDYNISGPSGQSSTFAIERFLVTVTK